MDKDKSLENVMDSARNVGEQVKSAVASTADRAQDLAQRAGERAGVSSETVQDLAHRAGEQASVAADVAYEQGTRAAEYVKRNVEEYPLTALLVAGMIGYGIAYLVHGASAGRN
jgi:ElaB/YqjD/DUF883 family membrane-anchored ribosome-binding protein